MRPFRLISLLPLVGLAACVGLSVLVVLRLRPSFERHCQPYVPIGAVHPTPAAAAPFVRPALQLADVRTPMQWHPTSRTTPPGPPVCVFFEAAPSTRIGAIATLQIATIASHDDPDAQLSWILPDSLTPAIDLADGWTIAPDHASQTTRYTQTIAIQAQTIYRFRLPVRGVRAEARAVRAVLTIQHGGSGGSNADQTTVQVRPR